MNDTISSSQDTIDITVGKKTRYWRYARYAAIDYGI